MPIMFTIERSGRTFNARADGGPPFFVGFSTSYTDKHSGRDHEGLFNVPSKALPKLLYSASAMRPLYGFWADMIAPTAQCEGGNYLTLNTYDVAQFTWGFAQFAAHVPDGDFVQLLRDLLQRPEADDYFPGLDVKNGRIVKLSPQGDLPLETAQSTQELRNLLNPSTEHIEDAEVIAAAKLIHWTTQHVAAQSLQVMRMIGLFRRYMRDADLKLGLDGRTADLCLIVGDIRHQGRAKYAAMAQALAAANPRNALLELGSIAYPERIKSLRAAVQAALPLLSAKRWSRAAQDFI